MKTIIPWQTQEGPGEPLPLPPRPGIQRRLLADLCPRCGVIHSNQASLDTCRQQVAYREQL